MLELFKNSLQAVEISIVSESILGNSEKLQILILEQKYLAWKVMQLQNKN